MGSLNTKELSISPSNAPAYFMSKDNGSGSCKSLQKNGNILLKATCCYNGYYGECSN